jgi:2-methylisocitrate lyase-like PEP mutase family enzyme
MTAQADRARRFRALHVKGDPLILCNVWDAGSARAVAGAGARALATSSWSVAAAQGLADGEAMPLDDMLAVCGRIIGAVDLPVTVDFEGGYAGAPQEVAANARRLLALGAAGLNFEDQVVGGTGLHPVAQQVARLQAIRQAADGMNSPAFLNARTDVFLKARPDAAPAALMDEVLTRAAAYAGAGADGLFVPGLSDPGMIRALCDRVDLPVNVMHTGAPQEAGSLAALGVARISFGPAPWLRAMQALAREAAPPQRADSHP